MEKSINNNKLFDLLTNTKTQFSIYLLINCIFITKYSQRVSPYLYIASIPYIITVTAIFMLLRKSNSNDNKFKYPLIALVSAICIATLFILSRIEPLSINVDRWSATTYFLNGLFSGEYPYGIHTHVSEYNYPSPFPMWQYINIPFWLMGDVGKGLLLFFVMLVFATFAITGSYKKTFIFTTLLALSPSYWWEIMVRSDGLSNQILILSTIILMYKKNISFENKWITTAVICGLCASTRMSAIIPLGIFLLKPFIKTAMKKKILSLAIIAAIVFVLFLPYILWDTETWIFFKRNPFMSQTSPANIWIVLIVVTATIIFSLQKYDISKYFGFTSSIMLFFFAFTMIMTNIKCGYEFTWSSPVFDISYLTLSLPYCMLNIITDDENHIRHNTLP